MTTDGLLDQIGGPRNRGFGKSRFKELLNSIQDRSMAGQKSAVRHALEVHQGYQSRRDDVAVLGFEVR